MARISGLRKAKLHLGCGCKIFHSSTKEEWYNLDMNPPSECLDKKDTIIKGDILALTGLFPVKTFDEIYSEFVFEHLPLSAIFDLLYQMWLILKDDGIIIVKVPNFLHIIKTFEEDCQEEGEDYSTLEGIALRVFCTERESIHRSVWTPASGRKYLEMDNLFRVTLADLASDKDGTMTYRMIKKQKD